MSSCSLCLHCFLSLESTQKHYLRATVTILPTEYHFTYISCCCCWVVLFWVFLEGGFGLQPRHQSRPLVDECCFIVTVVCNPLLFPVLFSSVSNRLEWRSRTTQPCRLYPRSGVLFSANCHAVYQHLLSAYKLHFWVPGLVACPLLLSPLPLPLLSS